MQTVRFQIQTGLISEPESQLALERAAAILRGGGLVALPTETVYGLGANALDAEAVARIFIAKERPKWDPLIVHVADEAMVEVVVSEMSDAARRLMRAFWPGPLTLLLPRSTAIPDVVTAGRSLAGVRMPAHPVALELIRKAGLPLAAPSANRFGAASPTIAEHVLHDLDGRIDAVLDAGPAQHGLESTVLDPNQSPMIVYRPGAISLEQIRKVAGAVELFVPGHELTSEPREALPSPGVGLRHYAPRARLILVEAKNAGEMGDLAMRVYREAAAFTQEKVGVMLPYRLPGENSNESFKDRLSFAELFFWGDWLELEELARLLFAGLRYLDGVGCTVIVCPVPPEQGIGMAIRDRLHKAASIVA